MQARLERQRREEALALLEMRKAVEHLQKLEGLLAEQDSHVSRLAGGCAGLWAAADCTFPVALPMHAPSGSGGAGLNPHRRNPAIPCPRMRARVVQLEQAAEELARKASARQERDMTARAMNVVQGISVQVRYVWHLEFRVCVGEGGRATNLM